MVCSKCEKKLSKSVNPDTWKDGSRSVDSTRCCLASCPSTTTTTPCKHEENLENSKISFPKEDVIRRIEGGGSSSDDDYDHDLTPRAAHLESIWREAERAMTASSSFSNSLSNSNSNCPPQHSHDDRSKPSKNN